MPIFFLIKSFIAGIIASFFCGLGALPLAFKKIKLETRAGLAFSVAGGLMISASFFNLLIPGLTFSSPNFTLNDTLLVITGIFSGSAFLWYTELFLTPERMQNGPLSKLGNKLQLLIFIAMSIHSIPEGVAVGVGYASDEALSSNLGDYLALAIALHNIPEGLAVAVPLRAAGASIQKCFWMAFLSSLPQPIAAVPAGIVSWMFLPIMPLLMGFAAGAMIFLVLMELIPEALKTESPQRIAWSFTVGFCLMLLVQVIL